MVGRRPKPTAIKLVEGNPGGRPINKLEPKPARGIPPCPEHLDDNGKAAWAHLTVLLDGIGVLTQADSLALERLVDCYADILACRELIAENGRTYWTRSQNGERTIKGNPAAAQLRAADSQFKSYLVEFGLTPAARSKVQASSDVLQQEDPLKEFFG